jgi:hypothetical protein
VSLPWPFPAIAGWFGGLPTHLKVVLVLFVVVVSAEWTLKRYAPRSRVYAAWKGFFEALGVVWTAVLLSLIYVVSVGPISLFMRLTHHDPLDRALAPEPSFWRAHEPNPLGPEVAARHQF